MVIDDDEISLSLISLILNSEGYEVIPASGGAAAIDTLASLSPRSHPDAVIADLQMPGLCGPALAAELRRASPKAKLLAMSATPGPADGYEAFLEKPLDLAALHAVLNGRGTASEQPPANEDEPALDVAVYEKMARMMSPAALREVYEACLGDAHRRVQEMRVAAEADDLASIPGIAHSLKGSTGMIGARKIALAAAELELGIYNRKQVLALIGNLLSCCDELHRILMAKLP